MENLKSVILYSLKFSTWLILLLAPSLSYACYNATPSSITIDQDQTNTFSVTCDSYCVAHVSASPINANYATVSPASQTIGAAARSFTVTGVAAGTTSVFVNWSCAAYGTGSSAVNITVNAPEEPDKLSGGLSTANDPNAASVKDPISTFSGELYNQFAADLSLGGPLGLSFSRYYGSGLSSDGIATGTLGGNWRHNFDWLLNNTGTEVEILSPHGSLIEFTLNATLWEQSANATIKYQLVEDGGSGEFTLLDVQNKRFYVFSSAGLLTNINDGRGNQHTLSYNGSDRLTQATDGLGRTLTFTYSGNKLSTVSDGTRTVSFTYNGDNLASSTSSLGNVTTYAYAAGGLMTSLTKPAGNTPITQIFDGNNRVTSQTDGEGNTTTLSYEANNVTTITDPLAAVTAHTHKASGELSETEDPDGNSVTIDSNTNGQRSSITDRLGDVTTISYHAPSGKLASLTNTEGNSSSYSYTARTVSGLTVYDRTGIIHTDDTTESMTYDASGNMTSHTDQLGNNYSFTYNNKGQRLTSTNPFGGMTTNTYNADATLASFADSADNITTFDFDSMKRPSLTTYPDGSTESFAYDNANRLLTATDGNNNTTTVSYDNNDNLKSITTPIGDTTTFAYDGNDRLLSLTDPLTGTVTTTYDQSGRVATFTDENGNVTTNGYDVLGQLTTVTDPLGNVWATSYDLEGVLASRTNPLGNTMTFTSDKMGRTTQITSPLGNNSKLTYDTMGLISTSTDPLGNVTTMSRDAAGFVSGIMLSDSSISTDYTRNQLGQILTVTDPNGNDWNRAYDNSGRLISNTDPLGSLRAVSYDNRNRISVVTYPGTMGTLMMGYDAAGRPISRTYSDGITLNYTYDANDRLVNADGITNTFDANGRNINNNGIASSYDAHGRIVSMTLAVGKSVTYAYDANDQLTSVTDWAGGITTFTYDAAGHLTAINRPNGINRTNTFDDDSRLIGITEGATASINFTRDAKGQILTAARTVPQLASASEQTDTSNTFDAASQIATHTYDTLGRTTVAGTNSFTWNLASRLTSYTKAGITTTATYDGAGLRFSRTVGATTSNYVWSYALVVPSILIEKQEETDLRYYIRMPGGELLYSINASTDTRSFYHFDEMGNTIFISDDAAITIGSYAYTPFGKLTSSTGGLDNPFTWQGEFGVMDEGDGLYYIRARYYDANSGQFISRDPIERDKPRSINPYQYAFGNPLTYRDISGRAPGEPNQEPTIHKSEIAGGATTVLGFGLKSAESKLAGGGLGLLGDSLALGIHLTEDEIDTGKIAEDGAMIGVDIGGIYLTAASATAEAGAITGASIAGPAVIIYTIAKLGIANYEAYYELQDTLQRIEATKFANKLNIKKAARRQAEKQARMEEEIRIRHEESLRREQQIRDQNKAADEVGKNDDDERRKALKFLGDLFY